MAGGLTPSRLLEDAMFKQCEGSDISTFMQVIVQNTF